MTFDAEEFASIYRREVGRCTATLTRVLGDVDAAEDAVADAFAVAARKWPDDGIPPNPGGWITTTARNRAIDGYRRDTTGAVRHRDALYLEQGDLTMTPTLGDLDVVEDDQLRLIFLCCHPALTADARVALTLRLLGGLETAEIARAFLVAEATIAQRIFRAKRKLSDNHAAFGIPDNDKLSSRLVSVHAAIYLIFNEGHTASSGDTIARVELTVEAIRLGRMLLRLLPNEPETAGLLAMMLLTEARRTARVDEHGDLVRLADQDRTMWDRSLISEGHSLVRDCLIRNTPGAYQYQAAISAVHADAPTADRTDWRQIVALYDQLLVVQPSNVVGLNRAIAVAQVDGARSGLDALDALDRADLDDYHLFHAARAEFLDSLGQHQEALLAIEQATTLTKNEPERRHLRNRRSEINAARPTAQAEPSKETDQ